MSTDPYVAKTLLRDWDIIRLPILKELRLRKSDMIISCHDLGYGAEEFLRDNPNYFKRPRRKLGDNEKIESSGRRLT